MDKDSIFELLGTGGSEFETLKENSDLLMEFFVLVESVDKLQKMDRRINEESLSLYQAISKEKEIGVLEGILGKFFGDPVKPAGVSVPDVLKRTHTFKHLSGIKEDQSLFIKTIGDAELYGALLPWPDKKNVITVHLGLCYPRLPQEDYQKIEHLIKDRMVRRVSKQVDSSLGGQVRGISLTSFLQMSEMERTTCTLRIISGDNAGTLYLSDGQLVDAETGELKHLEAAYSIIGWDNVTIEIQKTADFSTRAINVPLMQILMESLQQKDEEVSAKNAPPSAVKEKKARPPAKKTTGSAGDVPKSKREAAAGKAKTADFKTIGSIEVKPEESKGPVDKTKEETSRKPVKDEVLIDLELMDTVEKEKRILEKESERKKPTALAVKPKNKKQKALIALGVIAVSAVSVFLAFNLFFGQPKQSEYEILLAKISQLKDWDVKEKLLMGFINTHQPGEETKKAELKLQEILVEAEDAYYRKTTDEVNALPLDSDYEEKAKGLYKQFLERYPNSRYSADIEMDIPRIAKLSDDIHFSQLKNSQGKDYIASLKAYEGYLAAHPNGAHQESVKTRMQDVVNASYYDFKKRIQACEKAKTWSACIGICDAYSSGFQSYLSVEAIQPIRERIQSKKDYETLMAETRDADDATAKKMYLAYMQLYPKAEENETIRSILSGMDQKNLAQRKWETLKIKIRGVSMDPAEKMDMLQAYIIDNSSGPYVQEARTMLRQMELENSKLAQERYQAAQKMQASEQARKEEQEQRAAQLKIQKEKERIAQEKQKVIAILEKGGRFVVTQGEVAADQRTGLMWSLLDSQLERGQCLNYRSAVQYVKGLSYAGYGDWRLPTSGELAGIYKNGPFFPFTGAEWYWTSESFVKGYHDEANIVTSKPETAFKKQSVSTDACGAVRAVRP